MISIDTILNLTWGFLCASALGWHLWRDRKAGALTRVVGSRRTLSVMLAAVSLFPCISATDDRVILADFDWSFDHQTAFTSSQHHHPLLSFQLEDLEHAQTASPLLLAFVVCFFLMVPLETRSLSRWSSYGSRGRAPPVLACA